MQTMAIAYHPYISKQFERCDSTIVARLLRFVTKHQHNMDTFIQALTYAYNNQVHRYPDICTFSLLFTLHPP